MYTCLLMNGLWLSSCAQAPQNDPVDPVASSTYILSRTKAPLPYLEYGLGDDRLGGAKMTFLDSAVLLRVVDSVGDKYKIQLSKLHSAYVPKAMVGLLSGSVVKPYYLSNNMRVMGDDSADYVSVLLDERLPYRSVQQINPSRIAIDLFGVTTNTNWITQLNTAREIKQVYYEQTEDDVLRLYIELKHGQHWGYSIRYDSSGSKLVIKVKRQPALLALKGLTIAVDAGHGGDNTGASGVTSRVLEKNMTLLYAEELQKQLRVLGAKVVMTRTKDTSLTMPERILGLQRANPNLLISLHFNSGADTVRGTSTFYRYIGFRPLTQAILKQMLSLGLDEYGNVGNFNFALSGPTDYPNCLVEVAFLSNRAEEKKILNPVFRKAVARKIIAGITDWLNQCKTK